MFTPFDFHFSHKAVSSLLKRDKSATLTEMQHFCKKVTAATHVMLDANE